VAGGEMVSWWRDGLLVASWLVAKPPGGEMTGNPILKSDRKDNARS